VRLYAALANNGELRPLRYVIASDAPAETSDIRPNNSTVLNGHLSPPVANDQSPENLIGLTDQVSNEPMRGRRGARRGRQILSPEAAFLALEMLGNVPRPEMNCADGSHAAPVYWKTGTSHGFRDAWSIAVFDHYVLGVWIGNFDGRSNPEFIGRTAAAPLLFQIIDSLRAIWPGADEPHLPPPGANLKRVEFCAVSGDLPNAFCKDRIEGWFIPGVSPIKTCDVHREILVDRASGLRVPVDDGSRELMREVYEFWPGEFLTLFARAGVARKTPPPFLPTSTGELMARSGTAPRIISPSPNQEILLASTNAIPLCAKTDGDVREVYWFAGKTFLGKCDPRQVLSWKSAPGDYELTALDDHGRGGSSRVRVR
jgi:penicillin-binding protein 1C